MSDCWKQQRMRSTGGNKSKNKSSCSSSSSDVRRRATTTSSAVRVACDLDSHIQEQIANQRAAEQSKEKDERVEAARRQEKKRKERFSQPLPMYIVEPGLEEKESARFERCRLLGKGGFARCFSVMCRKTGEKYAVKAVQKTFLRLKDSYFRSWRNEVALTIKCAHPHVVKAYSSFEDDNFCYMKMPLYRSQTLQHLLQRRKKLSESEASYFLSHLLKGLQYLHSVGINHRDIKLGNMFLDDRMQLRIGDFGMSKKMKEGQRAFTLCGTPNYLAPETLGKHGYTFPVDIWAVGCIGYALLFGKPPFQTNQLRKTYQAIQRKNPVYLATWSDEVTNFLGACLQKEEQRRLTLDEALLMPFFTQREMLPAALPESVFERQFTQSTEQAQEDVPETAIERNTEQNTEQNVEKKNPFWPKTKYFVLVAACFALLIVQVGRRRPQL